MNCWHCTNKFLAGNTTDIDNAFFLSQANWSLKRCLIIAILKVNS